MKEEMGQDLPHKTFMEDAFVRKFMHGTWPELLLSEVNIIIHPNLCTQTVLQSSGQIKSTPNFYIVQVSLWGDVHYMSVLREQILMYMPPCAAK